MKCQKDVNLGTWVYIEDYPVNLVKRKNREDVKPSRNQQILNEEKNKLKRFLTTSSPKRL